MSENRDETTGQFASSEPVFGREGIEREHGYEPLKQESSEPKSLTIEEAAAEVAEQRGTPESEIKTYAPFGDLPENVSITLEQAADSLTELRKAEAKQEEIDQDEAIRNAVDELRGEGKPEEPAAPQEIDPVKALELPQVKEAIQKVTAETESARQAHVDGLAAATRIAEASFFNQFPEFNGLSPEQRINAFAAIVQNDPQRAEAIRASVGNIANLFQQFNSEGEKIGQEREAKQREWAKAESDRFEDLIKDTPKTKRIEIEAAIVESIKEYGGDIDAFVKLMRSSEFASATVQRLLWDVGQYRVMKKAPAKAIPKPVPPVQRPGAGGGPRPSDSDASIADLEKRFGAATTTEQQLRLAAKISGMKRAAARGQA